jgi:glycosyltransferase involved in cell wall biosynthesis
MVFLVSFLIPTLKERSTKFKSLTEKIFLQIEEHNLQNVIEVISIYDNRSIPLSYKRNMMQKMCSGKYFIHLDDDDRIADDYCISIVTAYKTLKDKYKDDPDIITYNQFCEVNNKFFIVKTNPRSDMNLNYLETAHDNIPIYERVPWQYHLWNRKRFSHIYRTDADTNAREDQNWLKKVYLEYPKTFHNIDKVLHYYYFDANGIGENKSTCQ